jgi:hypothetical protein
MSSWLDLSVSLRVSGLWSGSRARLFERRQIRPRNWCRFAGSEFPSHPQHSLRSRSAPPRSSDRHLDGGGRGGDRRRSGGWRLAAVRDGMAQHFSGKPPDLRAWTRLDALVCPVHAGGQNAISFPRSSWAGPGHCGLGGAHRDGHRGPSIGFDPPDGGRRRASGSWGPGCLYRGRGASGVANAAFAIFTAAWF